MTVVVRPKPRDRGNPSFFTETMIKWPDDAISATRRYSGASWVFKYRSDVLGEKRERMERSLRYKRASDTERRAAFVWVFHCPGLGGFAFKGWWAYLIGIHGNQYSGGGCKGNLEGKLLERAIALFPDASPLLFGAVDHQEWMQSFARSHQRGTWCGKPQGKAVVWAHFHGERVVGLELPANSGRSR